MENELKENEKQKAIRQQRSSMIIGSVIILMGLGFFFGGPGILANWWALVFLIPLGFIGSELYNDYQVGQPLEVGKVTGFLALLLVGSIFLFNLSWGSMWPLFIVLGGISVLLGGSKHFRKD